MSNFQAIALLREAAAMLGRWHWFRQKPQDLAVRIDAFLDAHETAPVDYAAIALACLQWEGTPDLRIDTSDTDTVHQHDGTWVRAWVRVQEGTAPVPVSQSPRVDREAYRAAYRRLPMRYRRLLALHHAEGLDPATIAMREGRIVAEVEQELAEALLLLMQALETDDDPAS